MKFDDFNYEVFNPYIMVQEKKVKDEKGRTVKQPAPSKSDQSELIKIQDGDGPMSELQEKKPGLSV